MLLFRTPFVFVNNSNKSVKIFRILSFSILLFKSQPTVIMISVKRMFNAGKSLIGFQCRQLNWTSRSHKCGELRLDHSGTRVSVAGWIQFIRMKKFLVLRDAYGQVQLIFKNENLWSKLDGISLESVLQVSGVVVPRPEGLANPKMETGEIEVEVDSIDSLNPAQKNLPFYIKDFNEGKEPLRMQYRYLDLRRPALQSNLRLRSEMVMKMRQFLTEKDFVDVETPTLFRRTPGGAREFVVPTHQRKKYYTLVQSPQQFKQLLMVGGLDRYFQIARCYRDEGARPDRQPEFTQVDIEMSFPHREGIEDLIEQLLIASWPSHLPKLETPFIKMKYQDCMKFYGCDKPDLRIDSKIADVTKIMFEDHFIKSLMLSKDDRIEAKFINFPSNLFKIVPTHGYLNKDLPDVLKKFKVDDSPFVISILSLDANGNLKSSLNKKLSEGTIKNLEDKIQLQPGDVGILVIANSDIANKCMAKVRTDIGEKFLDLNPLDYRFLWVEDFPLFLSCTELVTASGLESAHHPFTQPHPDDMELVYTEPLKVRGLHYDLVLNGFEIGGGSIRIHDWKLQEFVLKDVLGEELQSLSHLLEALRFGCPPHGGIALGLDRLVAILCQANSIRDVIAFPKSSDGKDLMADAPAEIRDEDKDYYHLK